MQHHAASVHVLFIHRSVILLLSISLINKRQACNRTEWPWPRPHHNAERLPATAAQNSSSWICHAAVILSLGGSRARLQSPRENKPTVCPVCVYTTITGKPSTSRLWTAELNYWCIHKMHLVGFYVRVRSPVDTDLCFKLHKRIFNKAVTKQRLAYRF